MMHIKNTVLKAIYICLFSFSSLISFSQVKLALFGGPQLTSAKYKIEAETQSTESKYGAQVGLGLKIPFENKLYFTPAMYYSLKGYKVTLNKPAFPPSKKAVNNDVRMHTVETAAMFQYDFTTKPAHFFIKSGFAIDFVLSGTEKFDTVPRGTVSRQMKFNYTNYNPISASANFHFGYESARGLIIFAQYAHGLVSNNNADHGPRIFNRIAGISLGYFLGKNSKLQDKIAKN